MRLVVVCASKTLMRAKANYSATEQECFDVVWDIVKLPRIFMTALSKILSTIIHFVVSVILKIKPAHWSIRVRGYTSFIWRSYTSRRSDIWTLTACLDHQHSQPFSLPALILPFLVFSARPLLGNSNVATLRCLIWIFTWMNVLRVHPEFLQMNYRHFLRNSICCKRKFSSTWVPCFHVSPIALRTKRFKHLTTRWLMALCHTKLLTRMHRYYWPQLNSQPAPHYHLPQSPVTQVTSGPTEVV